MRGGRATPRGESPGIYPSARPAALDFVITRAVPLLDQRHLARNLVTAMCGLTLSQGTLHFSVARPLDALRAGDGVADCTMAGRGLRVRRPAASDRAQLANRKAALVLVPVLPVMAGVQAVQQHAWAPLAVLVLMAVVLTVHPVADGALSRASELAADKYAVSVGSSLDLISALGVRPCSWSYDTGQLHGTTAHVEVHSCSL